MAQKLPEHESFHLLGQNVLLRQGRDGLRAGTDCVLLAAVPIKAHQVLELGCAVGQTLLCYGVREARAILTGVEYQHNQVSLAQQNIADNAVMARMRVVQGDFSDKPQMQALGIHSDRYDLVLMNPPYFDARHHSLPQHIARQWTHIEHTSLADWIAHGLRYTRQFGHLAMIHRPERLPEILSLLRSRAGNIRVLPIHARTDKAANRLIIVAQKSRQGAMQLLPGLVMHEGNDYSVFARKILEQAQSLPMNLIATSE